VSTGAPFRGLEPGTRPTIPPHPEHGTETTSYAYVSAAGAPLYFVCRYETPEGKTFLQGRPGTNGKGWLWNLRGVTPVLYRLDELAEFLASGKPGPVYIVEGEKAADRLRDYLAEHSHPGVVTTSPMGAGKWREHYTETLTGARHVVIVVDNDEIGFKHGRAVRDALAPVVDRVQLLRPALDHEHAGVDDHLDAGLSLEELVELEEEPTAEEEPAPILRTRGVDMERVRPITWAWERRIPNGYPSLIVGEEGIGKGTAAAWIIARATRGELEGDLHGSPTVVLIVGDEDAFEPIWVPRLYAAGADLTRVLTLDDGEYLDDFVTAAGRLGRTIERDGIGLAVFDQLIDHVAGGIDGSAVNNPKHVRQALVPLRRVAAEQNIATVGLMHPIKGQPRTFRELVAGSHQFNAVSRSSLMLGADPEGGEHDRILVRGKGNYSAAPRSLEFTIAAEVVELGGHTFEVPKVVNVTEGERTIEDLLKPPAAPVRTELEERLEPLLTDEPQKLADLARAVDREPKDGSVRNALRALEERKIAEQVKGGWKRR
jgi:hypothetical protein